MVGTYSIRKGPSKQSRNFVTASTYSWANSSGKIKCPLDFWLISKQLLTRVTERDISPYYDSDHSPVTISLTPEDQGVPGGPGFWRLNNSLLENEEFVTKLKFLIQNANEKYKEVTDKGFFGK